MLLALGLFATANALSLKPCGGLFYVQKLGFKPFEPIPGANITFNLEYLVPPNTLVARGVSQTTTSYNYIPLQPETVDLCEQADCPIGPGIYVNSTTVRWPSDISGVFTTTLKWFDLDRVLLLCLKLTGSLKSRALTLWKSRTAH